MADRGTVRPVNNPSSSVSCVVTRGVNGADRAAISSSNEIPPTGFKVPLSSKSRRAKPDLVLSPRNVPADNDTAGSDFSKPSANVVLRRSEEADPEPDVGSEPDDARTDDVSIAAVSFSDVDVKRVDVDVRVMPTFPLDETVFEKTK